MARDVNLSAWNPKPHFVLTAFLASSLNGDGCGLVVVRMGTGRMPCLGAPLVREGDTNSANASIANHQKGDVLTDQNGQPIENCIVQYWRAGDGSQTLVAETKTNARGKHTVWLEPGTYRYRYVDALASREQNPPAGREVVVLAGRRVSWEEPLPDAVMSQSEVSESPSVSPSSPPSTITREKEIAGVWEDLICDWHCEDGQPFDWNDVENTCVQMSNKAANVVGGGLQQLSVVIGGPFGFAKPDILQNLQAKGVPCMDIGWRDLQFAVAYRQFAAIQALGPCLKAHERANHQIKMVSSATGARKIVTRPGERKYLADARVAAFYQAAQLAAYSGPAQNDGIAALQASLGPLAGLPSTTPMPNLPFAPLGPMPGSGSFAEQLGMPPGFNPLNRW